ncbi:MAG TPA: Hsp20/alpha crystallin family protein [Chitinophagaceae bacterium]|nr:Hsp20/alpha crystallin family protein [Chitinophagaceae bacterium]
MQTINDYHNDIYTYPGSYTPIQFKMETLKAGLVSSHQRPKNPPCNISETNEYYKIELAVPGLKRDDFFAGINCDGKLAVSAFRRETGPVPNGKYRKHAFNYDSFSCRLPLPQNVDTDFVKAEYREGVLLFLFLKTEKPYQKRPSVIVIY